MKNVIDLGAVRLDAREIAGQGNAVLGIRASGKSYLGTLLAERLMDAGVPIVAFDPIGVWRFLRVPGKGPGYPVVVAGGEHGDLPLTPDGAPEIVRAAMREGVSLVIDLYSMKLSKADWRRIVERCVRVLLYENKSHGLRHVFIEEAAEFAPQQVSGDYGNVYAEVEKMARMGGNALLGYTLISQRSEQVNKAVLELCDGLFLFRQKGRLSLTALSKWLDIGSAKGGADVIASLPTLPQGVCWAWLAGHDTPVRIDVPTKRTFHPDRAKMHGDAVEKVNRSAVDVGTFVTQMKGSLEKIVEEAAANDPAKLKAQVRQLTVDLQKARQNITENIPAPDAALLDQSHAEGYQKGYGDGFGRGWGEGAWAVSEAANSSLHDIREALTDATVKAEQAISDAVKNQPPAPNSRNEITPARSPSPPQGEGGDPLKRVANQAYRTKRPEKSSEPASPGDTTLTGPQRKLLQALAWWKAMGHDEPTRAQLAGLIGWAVKGSNLRNRLADVSSAGLITYPPKSGTVRLTPAGVAAAPTPDMAVTLVDSIRNMLTGPQAKLFEVLLGKSPITRAELAAKLGWEDGGSNLRNRLADLSSYEIIEYPERGSVALQTWVTE